MQTPLENTPTTYTSVELPKGTSNSLVLLVKAMRPKQWTKNLLLFAAVIFAQKTFVPGYLLKSFYAFIIFCFLSGSVYLINDLVDIEKDKLHPIKKNRPLASGRIKVSFVVFSAIFITLVSLSCAFFLQPYLGWVALAYFLTTLSYTFKLKNIVIIDVIVIAIGFICRALAGIVVINVAISPWLLVCTFLLALFLALTKRRHELLLLDEKAHSHREILNEYLPEMLDQMISVVTSSTVMAYSLYTFTSGHSVYLMTTIPFVIYGIFRYLYLVHKRDFGGSPEAALLKDPPMLINIILWVVACSLILYFG